MKHLLCTDKVNFLCELYWEMVCLYKSPGIIHFYQLIKSEVSFFNAAFISERDMENMEWNWK